MAYRRWSLGLTLVLSVVVACRGASMASDVAELGGELANPLNQTRGLSHTAHMLDVSVTQLHDSLADLKGGKAAKQTVDQGLGLITELNAVNKRAARSAKQARRSQATAEAVASKQLRDPKVEAAEVTSKLLEAREAKAQATAEHRRSQSAQEETRKLAQKAKTEIEEADSLKVNAARRMVDVQDRALYELAKAEEARKEVAGALKKGQGKGSDAKEKLVEDKAAADKANAKVQHEKDKAKLETTKAADAAKLAQVNAKLNKDEAKLKGAAVGNKKEKLIANAANAKANAIEKSESQEKAEAKLALAQAKIKKDASKAELRRAKAEENSSFEKLKKSKHDSEKAVDDSMGMKVSVIKGAPVDQSAVTAARKAASAIKDFEETKAENLRRHEEVIEATKAYTKAAITHRVMQLSHESKKQAKKQQAARKKKQSKKAAKKIIQKAKEKGEEREERIMRRARQKARKEYSAEKKKLKKKEKAEIKAFAKAKGASKVQAMGKSAPCDKKIDPDRKAAEVAIAKHMGDLFKADAAKAADGDKL